MKLIPKTIIAYLLVSLPLLFGAGLFSFHYLKNIVREETDESLWKEKLMTEAKLASLKEAKEFSLGIDGISSVRIVSEKSDDYTFSDTLIYDKYEDEQLNYRILKAFFNSRGNSYLITIAKPTIEEDDITEAMLSTLEVVMFFLLAAFFLVNWLVSKVLWKPFYKTLDQLSSYDLVKSNLKIEKVSTKEFRLLNEVIEKMTAKMHVDFLREKEFTENASHEMQTPLAVMKGRIELLMQSKNLGESEMNDLQTLESSVNKLASLNRSLLLLAKIENRQFVETQHIDLKETVAKIVFNYMDQAEIRNITIETDLHEAKIEMDPALCEIMISNLLQNAIRHNTQSGAIRIELKNKSLTFINSGEKPKIDGDEIFTRFKKGDASRESTGLGLSIVKSICNLYGFAIRYEFKNEHTFKIEF